MISEIKKIKLEKIENEIFDLQKQYFEKETGFRVSSNSIKEETLKRKKELKEETIKIKKELQNVKYIKNNLYNKIFNKNELMNSINEMRKLGDLINKKERKYRDLEFIDIADYNFDNLEYKNSIKKITRELDKIKSSKTIFDLGINFAAAEQFLKDHNKDLVLEKEDIELSNNNKIFFENEMSQVDENCSGMDCLSNYILIHKRRYFPRDGKIRTIKNAGIKFNAGINIGEIKKIDVPSIRNTIHFSVNDEVQDHVFGGWSDCKYAVLIPLKNMPKNQLRCLLPVDSYIEGDLKLPEETIVLCPFEEREAIENLNNSFKVVYYSGENVSGYAAYLAGTLGYKLEDCNNWSWNNDKDVKQYKEVIKKSGLNVNFSPHSTTELSNKESDYESIEYVYELINKILSENLSFTNDEIICLINKVSDIHYINVVSSLNPQKNNFSYKDEEKNNFEYVKTYFEKRFEKYNLHISDDIINAILATQNKEDAAFKYINFPDFYDGIFNNVDSRDPYRLREQMFYSVLIREVINSRKKNNESSSENIAPKI